MYFQFFMASTFPNPKSYGLINVSGAHARQVMGR